MKETNAKSGRQPKAEPSLAPVLFFLVGLSGFIVNMIHYAKNHIFYQVVFIGQFSYFKFSFSLRQQIIFPFKQPHTMQFVPDDAVFSRFLPPCPTPTCQIV